jgi:subtilisin family serine protease
MVKGLILIVMLNGGNEKIKGSLKKIMGNKGSEEKIEVIVHLKEKPDFEKIKNLNPKEYVEYLKNFCKNSQKDIINYLKKNFPYKISDLNPYFIFNGFYLRATKDVIEKISEREDVEYIIEDFIVQIEKKENSYEIETPPWNIIRVKADSCWMIGYTGEGVIIGHMDTGVDINHPALSGKWLSPYWYDFVNGQTIPYDDNGHGTHTMGTILGGDGLGPFSYDIGVAPGAKFVACKVFDNQGSGYSSWIHSGFQKILEWKGEGVPIVALSNSWGQSSTTSLEFWNDCLNLLNANILSVFPAARVGTDSQTVSTPASFPIVMGIGDPPNSGKGPAPDLPPWNNPQYWLRPDWNRIKPDICAPSQNITSSVPGGGYQTMSGMSFTCPHVTGGIAILYQKNSNLTIPQVYNLLLDYAYKPPQGGPYPNNTYGWGYLDIYQALLHTPVRISEPSKLIIPSFEKAKIKIYNITGRKIKEIYFDLNEKTISRIHVFNEKIPQGIYFIKFETKGYEKNLKIIYIK